MQNTKRYGMLSLAMAVALVGCGGGSSSAPSTPSNPVVVTPPVVVATGASWKQTGSVVVGDNGTALGTSVLTRPDGSKLVVFGGPEVAYTPNYTFTCNQTSLHAVQLTAGALTDATSVLAETGTSIHTRAMAVADFNGDGREDLFVANHGCDNPLKNLGLETNKLFMSSGNQLTDASAITKDLGNAFTHSVTAAVTGYSQNVDVLVGVMGIPGAYILRGDGAGKFTKDASSLNPNLGAFTSSKFSDVNGDGKVDLIVGYDQTGATVGAVVLNDGKGNFTGPVLALPVGLLGAGNTIATAITTTDVNQDGKVDLIIAGTQNGPTYYGVGRVQILVGNGDGTFSDKTITYLPVNNNVAWTQVVHVVDLDGDGKDDLLLQIQDPQAADMIAYKNTGSGYTAMARSSLPATVTSLIPVKTDGVLTLVSLAANGSSVTATAYQLK